MRALHEHADLVVVGLRLGERVIERDVDGVDERLVRVDLGNQDAVAVGIQHRGDAGEHDVVIVDQPDQDR